ESAIGEALLVKLVRLLPSVFMTTMSRPERTTIFVPSGDQAGALSLGPEIACTFVPSAFMTLISGRLEEELTSKKAIWVASGDQSGESTGSLDEAWTMCFP